MTDELKPRFDLIPAGPLRRCALRMAEGLAKHPQWPSKTSEEYLASALRHMNAIVENRQFDCKIGEDHKAAVVCCIMMMMQVEMAKALESIGAFETPPPPKSFTGSLTYPRE